MRTYSLNRLCETAILVLLAFTILWKGGKTLESTWLLVGVAGICTLVQSLGRFQVSGFRFQDRKRTFAIILFILWTGLSYIFSKTQNYGLDEVLRDGALGLLLLWYLRREPETNNPSTRASLGAGHSDQLATSSFEERWVVWLARLTIASCIIGIAIYIFQPVNRFVGTFVDPRFHTDYWPNAFAEFLLLTWPVVLLKDMGNHSLHRLSLGLVFGSLLLTYSRGAFIAFLGQVLLLLALLFMSGDAARDRRKPLLLIISSLAMGVLLFFSINGIRSLFHTVQPLGEKITFQAAEGTSSISERKDFWKQAALLSLQKPLFGWGPYSFRFVQPRLQEHVLATSDHPHNVFLKLAMERGIITPLLFAFIACCALFSGFKTTLAGKRLFQEDHTRLQAPLLTVSLAGVLAHNLIDFNLQFVGITLPFWVMMGMLFSSLRPAFAKATAGRQGYGRQATSCLQLATFLTVSLLLLLAFREGVYLVTSSLGRHAEARGDTEAALTWYEASEQEWFTRDLQLSEAHLLLQEEKREDAEAAVRSYLEKNAEDARAWKLLGDVLAERGDFPAAIEVYDQAFAYGSWNDLSISSDLLEALFAETYRQPTSDAAAESARLPLHPRIALITPEIERRVFAFAEAIEQNRHFIALSPNPEEASKILITLAVLYPEKREHYQVLRERIEQKAEEERGRIKARSPGMLW